MSGNADQLNPMAQSLMTLALQQQAVLSTGFLQEQAINPQPDYPRRPWIDEPYGSVPFDQQNGLALDVVGTTQVVVSMLVPIGMDGVIKYISNNTVFPFNNFSGDLQWQILRNKQAIRNFDNILTQKGTVEIPRPVSPIRIYSGDLIEYVVKHIANVALNGDIVCCLNGYFYPAQGQS